MKDKYLKMKKVIAFLVTVTILISCKEEVVKKPERLIDKDVMINVMYDLTVLEAIKYQNPASLDTFKINPTHYIYKKYKIDSLQFAKSNIYYASDYKGYKVMFEKMTQRLEDNKKQVDSLLKIDQKKKIKPLKKKQKIVKDSLQSDKSSL